MASDPVLDAIDAGRTPGDEVPHGLLRDVVDGFRGHPVLTAEEFYVLFWTAMYDGDTAALKALLTDDRVEAALVTSALASLANRGNLRAVQLLLADYRADPFAAQHRHSGTVSAGWAAIIAAARWKRRRNWIRAGAVKSDSGFLETLDIQ
jgi:hypothetical protein